MASQQLHGRTGSLLFEFVTSGVLAFQFAHRVQCPECLKLQLEVVILPQDILMFCSPDKTQLLILNSTPLFFSNRDGQWFPTLRLLHQYPDMMKKARVDQGAIKFVLSGANIMCPGLTSPGATLHDEV